MQIRRALTVVLVLVLIGAGSCGSDSPEESGSTSTSSPANGSPSTTVAATTTSPATTSATASSQATTTPSPSSVSPSSTQEPVPASVYWAWTVPTITFGTPERLGAGTRDVAEGDVAAALEAMLAGPDDVETEIGMGTEIPAGTSLLAFSVDAGTAVVDLSGEFETPSGTLSETMRLAQVVFTLTQDDEVDRVRFRIDGVDVDAIGSHGFDVSGGVDRDDFADVRPFILLEVPGPGTTVDAAGFVIAGEANTFEASVQWAVTDGDGLIVAEGFTTATAGNGEWGRFQVPVELPAGTTGPGAVIVFDISAVDGSQIDVVEYPVEIS
ncbi:MAG: GerMN domain-containing protein [Acidimicrobiales bacterium]